MLIVKGSRTTRGTTGSRGNFPFGLFGPFGTFVPSQLGFTLIELLIVVAIIGILATLLMTNFIGIRQRARDAQRKSDIRQMQSALEVYRSDYGKYPTNNVVGGFDTLNTVACPTSSSFVDAGGTTYMQNIPCDPLGTTSVYNGGNYYYLSSGSTYIIAACLENTSDSEGVSNGATVNGQTFNGGDNNCNSGTGKYFVKTNP